MLLMKICLMIENYKNRVNMYGKGIGTSLSIDMEAAL